MNPAEATRQIYWNVSHIWLMYALLLPTLAVAAWGVYRRVRLWRLGKPLARFDHPAERFKLVLKHALAQQRTATDPYAGFFHRFIFYGFIVLTIATTIVALDADAGLHIMHGALYLYFQSFLVDVAGVLVMVGIVMAAGRRYLVRPKKLVYTSDAAGILALLFVIIATGFLLQGWRIAATGDPWAAWSPFGNLVAHASLALMSVSTIKAAHQATWWFHLALCFAFIAWIPYTKMMHVITGPLNIYTSNLRPVGAALKPVNFEDNEPLGVNALQQFTWKDLLDLDACTECGRCSSVCPANTVGKELSPRDIILELRGLMRELPAKTPSPKANGADGNGVPAQGDSAPALPPLIGAVPATSPEALWECTTCAACMEACPVFIEQMPKIVDMRRHLVMEVAEFPPTLQEAVTSLESRGHPFRGTQASRVDWCEGLNVTSVGESSDFDVLLWVGCGGALVERNQKVTRATAQLLQKAGVKFAILGREEKCCGDPARRIGNEFLFEMLAKDVVAKFEEHHVKKIVTACPHCLNTLRNEYPQYGGAYQVYHHSEFLAKLVEDGALEPRAGSGEKITFHDPCYLGRHNGEYGAPRQLVQIAAGQPIAEMTRNRSSSFCCGGGGGMSFVEEPPSQRVNQERAREAMGTGAETVSVACPFCMTMLEDGMNAVKDQRDVRVRDIAELLWQAVEAGDPSRAAAGKGG